MFWYLQESLLCPDLSHWVTFIQKLYCDWSYGKSHIHYFTGSLICQFEHHLISQAFFVVPECPTTPPGRDLLGSLGAKLQLWHHKQSLFLILTRTKQLKNKGLFPVLFFTQYTLQFGMKKKKKKIPVKAINAQSVKISLKPEVAYLNKSQYPTKVKAKNVYNLS